MSGINAVNASDAINFPEPSTKRKDVQKQEFLQKFQNIQSDQVRSHLEGLYDKIADQSEKISDRLHLSEVVKYKELVRDFLDVATKNSHQFSKQNFLDRRGRHRVYGIVKQVDRELENLTKEFLKQEVDRISVIKKLDDIRGLLVDVFM
ncbi:YaaR family protein [Serpentinicella sp. ANB-PHB4]|uniref:YaaR family protein n=1 Tax=Serpentinicella sp. ANB-PHB4 TaxID=3074076 RepID=UPI002855EA86|nr:YaaR family protein [Serpentinicella sp. ANB-PHB4]MDR5659802.1 YaaR family protein [Serpentinicella sp. ANB-PHB4]